MAINKLSQYYFKKASDYSDKNKDKNYWKHERYQDYLSKAKYYSSFDNEKAQTLITNLLDILKMHEKFEAKIISDNMVDTFNPYNEFDTLYIGRKSTNMEIYINKYFGNVSVFNNTKDLYNLYKQGVDINELLQIYENSGRMREVNNSLTAMQNREEIINRINNGEHVPIHQLNFGGKGRHYPWVPKDKMNQGSNVSYWTYNKESRKYDIPKERVANRKINDKILNIKNVKKVSSVKWKK